MNNNNRGVESVRKEKERKKYWSNIIDIGIGMSFSFTTLLIGFQNESERAQNTVAAMALTTVIGLACYFSSMSFVLGSAPNAILASLGACCNMMVLCFMVVYVHLPESHFVAILEIASCVTTLLIIICMSRASIRAFLCEWSAKLVTSGWEQCGGFVALVVTFFDNQSALVTGCCCDLFGAVTGCCCDLFGAITGCCCGLFGAVAGCVLGGWASFKVYVRSRCSRFTSYVRGLFRPDNRTRTREEDLELASLGNRDV